MRKIIFFSVAHSNVIHCKYLKFFSITSHFFNYLTGIVFNIISHYKSIDVLTIKRFNNYLLNLKKRKVMHTAGGRGTSCSIDKSLPFDFIQFLLLSLRAFYFISPSGFAVSPLIIGKIKMHIYFLHESRYALIGWTLFILNFCFFISFMVYQNRSEFIRILPWNTEHWQEMCQRVLFLWVYA